MVTYHGPTASTPAARQPRMLGDDPHGRVALLQRRLADRVPEELGVRALPCPFEVSRLLEAMWWHPVYDEDPEHRYLRELVIRATAAMSG